MDLTNIYDVFHAGDDGRRLFRGCICVITDASRDHALLAIAPLHALLKTRMTTRSQFDIL